MEIWTKKLRSACKKAVVNGAHTVREVYHEVHSLNIPWELFDRSRRGWKETLVRTICEERNLLPPKPSSQGKIPEHPVPLEPAHLAGPSLSPSFPIVVPAPNIINSIKTQNEITNHAEL